MYGTIQKCSGGTYDFKFEFWRNFLYKLMVGTGPILSLTFDVRWGIFRHIIPFSIGRQMEHFSAYYPFNAWTVIACLIPCLHIRKESVATATAFLCQTGYRYL